MSQKRCIDCFENNTITQKFEGNDYVFCLNCNPNKLIYNGQKGYFGICMECDKNINMTSEDRYCTRCDGLLCITCYDKTSYGSCSSCIKIFDQKKSVLR